jgi:hypothetical protein
MRSALLLVLAIGLNHCPGDPAPSPTGDAPSLATPLSSVLAGYLDDEFTNAEQAEQHPEAFPLTALSGCPMDVAGLGTTMYVAEAPADRTWAPTHQHAWEIVDVDGGVRVEFFAFPQPEEWVGTCELPVQLIDRSELIPLAGCGIELTFDGDTFHGGSETMAGCPGFDAAVATTESTLVLGADELRIWHRGRDEAGTQLRGGPGWTVFAHGYAPMDPPPQETDDGWAIGCDEVVVADTETDPFATAELDAYECNVGPYPGPERTWVFTPEQDVDAEWRIVTPYASERDFDVFVLSADGECLGWNANAVDFEFRAGEEYQLVVDGYNGVAGYVELTLICG